MSQVFSVDQLVDFMTRTYVACGMPAADARSTAEMMIEADLLGSDAHGIFRLPQYVKRIRAGGFNLHPQIRIERETVATALIDGDNAMGHLVMRFAAETAIAKAKVAGVAWVGLHHGNHAGAGAVYARMPLAHDMVGIYGAVGSANHLPPWGGIEMLLSTNPLAIAVPAHEEPPVVLDMATTVASYGKIKARAQRGEMMPEGWMMGNDGKPLLDPKRASEGFLMPIGGHKGYGLALACDILAGIVAGAGTIQPGNPRDRGIVNGMLSIVIDPSRFGGGGEGEYDALMDYVLGCAPAEAGGEVMMAGDPERASRATRSRDGIPVDDGTWQALTILAADLAIAPPDARGA